MVLGLYGHPVYHYIENNNFLNVNQHGFRSGRSCLSQLLEHHEKIIGALEKNHNYDVIYTDFAKAFDKCDHGIIAHKIKSIGITGKLGKWIYNFLTNRKQTVKLRGSNSQESIVKSSVPQGTVLAPLLFIILIADIDRNVTGSEVCSFADDTKISKEITKLTDAEVLQKDMITLCNWAHENNMTFNEDKFQLLRYGKKEELKHSIYSLPEGKEIEPCHQVRDLGVTITDDAKFGTHIEISTNKAKRNMGLILRSFKSRDKEVMLPLFKTMVIPILEYCSILTAPYKQEEIIKIESIQRHFTSKIDGMEHLTYQERLEKLDLYSLERRRERYFIIYIWKILEGLVPNITKNPILIYNDRNSRRGRTCRIPPLVTRQGESLTMRENSFTVRGPKLFNLAPKEVRNLTGVSLERWKRRVDAWLRTVPDEPSCPGTVCSREAQTNSLLHQAKGGARCSTGGEE